MPTHPAPRRARATLPIVAITALITSLTGPHFTASANAQQPSALAADATATGSASAASSDGVKLTDKQLHQGLRDLMAVMQKALNESDIDTIIANASENVVFTTMNGDIVHGRKGVRAYFDKMMKGPDKIVSKVTSQFVAEDLSVLYGGDMAVAYGHTDDQYELTDGDTFDIRARWSATLVLDKGKWSVANFHYSTNMFSNPILEAQRKMMMLIAAILAVVLAAVGFFIGRKSGSK